MSLIASVAPGAKLVASEPNASLVPSGDHASPNCGRDWPPVVCWPLDVVEMRVIIPVARSFTKTSQPPLVSPATRFEATDVKATFEPSGEKIALAVEALPSSGDPVAL